MRSYLPSYKTMIWTILAITLVFAIDFMVSGKKKFFQLYYSWGEEKVLRDLGSVQLDSVSYNYVGLSGTDFTPDPQRTYKLTLDSKSYYFRYVFVESSENHLAFKGVEYVTGVPQIVNKTYQLEEVWLPLKEVEGPSVLTLGDRLLIANEAKYYRKDLGQIAYPIQFIGSKYDVFNFAYEADKAATSSDLLTLAPTLPKADTYIIMYGENEDASTEQFAKQSEELLDALLEKNPETIIVLGLPPSLDNALDVHHAQFNSVLRKLSIAKGIVFIDTYQVFSENIEKFIREDGISISRDGYYELAKLTSKQLP